MLSIIFIIVLIGDNFKLVHMHSQLTNNSIYKINLLETDEILYLREEFLEKKYKKFVKIFIQ